MLTGVGIPTGLPLRKVESQAIKVLPTNNETVKRFDPRPEQGILMKAYYKSAIAESGNAAIAATSTDDGGRGRRRLESENRRLAKENAALRDETRQHGGARAGREDARGPRAVEHRIASESEDDEFADPSDAESELHTERPDGLMQMLMDFDYGRAGGKSRGAGGRSPRRRQPPNERDHAADGDGEAQASRRRTPERREVGAAMPTRRSPGRRGRGGTGRGQGSRALEFELQLEMVKILRELKSQAASSTDDAPDANVLDGLRIMRSMGRMRALKEQMKGNPLRICREYKERWVQDLGAESRAFRWIDVNRHLRWKKYTSIRRCHYMLCIILEMLEKREYDVAQAQTVQCMKCLQEFIKFGSWRAAWELTYLNDPLKVNADGGNEVEMETILAFLRTRDDIHQKSQKATKEAVSEGEGEDQADRPEAGSKGAGKAGKKNP